MRGLIAIFSSLALVMLAGQAHAQSARKMAEHGDWATYSYQAQNGRVCYVLTVPKPKSMQPSANPLPMIMSISLPAPSALSAAIWNDVAMPKKKMRPQSFRNPKDRVA